MTHFLETSAVALGYGDNIPPALVVPTRILAPVADGPLITILAGQTISNIITIAPTILNITAWLMYDDAARAAGEVISLQSTWTTVPAAGDWRLSFSGIFSAAAGTSVVGLSNGVIRTSAQIRFVSSVGVAADRNFHTRLSF